MRESGMIEQVVVVYRDRLLAYVIAGKNYEPAQMEAYLRTHLPDYMVPAVIPLDQFPLLANGKVNRKGLPDPEVAGKDSYVPAVTELQKGLVAIWEELLEVERVGLTDNFF